MSSTTSRKGAPTGVTVVMSAAEAVDYLLAAGITLAEPAVEVAPKTSKKASTKRTPKARPINRTNLKAVRAQMTREGWTNHESYSGKDLADLFREVDDEGNLVHTAPKGFYVPTGALKDALKNA